ncbi:hypothetical protein LX36DRAFT_316833 [Colletotrichum falcatum]|nr:hypothetical protein LX36DRAFT_316833 [Colletotrichum falcatum]
MFSKATIAITSLLALAETVSSDPKTFEIVIINQSSYPGVSQTVAKVNAADGKYELKGIKVAPGGAYRINLVSTDPQNSGILAQSEEFTFEAGDDTSSSAAASATASASASATGSSSATAATGTAATTASGLTTSVTGSSTATASGASSSGAATGTATGTAASGTSTSAPNSASSIKSTFAIFGSVAVAAYMLF